MFFALLAAVLDAVYIIGTRKLLELKKRVNYGIFFILLFFFLFIFSLALYPFFGQIQTSILETKYIFLFILMIILAVAWNILFYKTLHEEKLVEFELVTMIYPLAAIFLAAVLIPKDFNIHVFISGIVGGAALLIAHIKRKHLNLNKIEKKLFLTILLMASEAVVIDYLLPVISPVALYTIRTGAILMVFLFIYRKQIKNIVFSSSIFYNAFLALLGVGFNVLCYEAYKQIGVGFTILILILTPIIAFLYAHFKEKENMSVKKILAASIIILCIVYAYLLY